MDEESFYKEVKWRDIRYAAREAVMNALFGCAFFGLIFAEDFQGMLKSFSQRKLTPARAAPVLSLLQVVAKNIGNPFFFSDRIVIGGSILAIAPALAATYMTAGALGFSFGGLLTAHAAGVAAAGLAGLAAGMAALPVAAFVLLTTPMLLGGLALSLAKPKTLAEGLRRGRNAVSEPPQSAPQEEEPAPAIPALTRYFGVFAGKMEKSEAPDRERYLTALRKTFPADFAEALNSSSHDPALRKTVVLRPPLRLKKGLLRGRPRP